MHILCVYTTCIMFFLALIMDSYYMHDMLSSLLCPFCIIIVYFELIIIVCGKTAFYMITDSWISLRPRANM